MDPHGQGSTTGESHQSGRQEQGRSAPNQLNILRDRPSIEREAVTFVAKDAYIAGFNACKNAPADLASRKVEERAVEYLKGELPAWLTAGIDLGAGGEYQSRR
jgi:hypothetical protein